jgi:hypothetical protein
MQLRDALIAGLCTLDKQAAVLMLSRSTTWNLLKGNHKGSGLSASVVKRILAAPQLPDSVRVKVIEYVAEKAAGLYGGSKLGLNKFVSQLPFSALEHTGPAVGTPKTRLSFVRKRTAHRVDLGRNTTGKGAH